MASSQPPNLDRELAAAAFARLSPAQIQTLTTKILLIHQRAEAGTISRLEAAIEQTKLLLEICPFEAASKAIAALEAFNDGDDAELRFLLEN